MGNGRIAIVVGWTSLWVLMGCGSSGARKPPGVPPTPISVTRDEPGGDAADPVQAALLRLGSEGWGWRNDKRDYVHFPLSDWANWRRVRFWGVPTFVGFRYGNKHHAVAAMWARRLRTGDAEDPSACMQYAQEWAEPILDTYRATIQTVSETRVPWRAEDDVLLRTINARVAGLLSSRTYYCVVGAVIPWPHTCAVYGYAFYADEEDDAAAAKARDRYAREAFRQLTLTRPSPPDDLEVR
jgi:hypothetical protein